MAAPLPESPGALMIPGAERNDPELVRSNLALALADFERGQLREALSHLRRAAESADDAGNELRAVALARAAADLATEVGSASPPPAPVSPIAAAPSLVPASVVRGSSDAALQQLLDSGRAVKVVIKRSVRDEGLYIVRRAEAHGAALGAREAVVVLLEPDAGFFTAEAGVEPPAAAASSEPARPYPSLAPADDAQK